MNDKEKQISVITETLEYYRDHERGEDKDSGQCNYTIKDSCGRKTHCAVGRCLKREFQTYKFSHKYQEKTPMDIFNFQNMLKKKYRGMHIDFWVDLQCLHDSAMYWLKDNGKFKNKISHIGRRRIATMFGIDGDEVELIVKKVYEELD